MGGSSRYEGRLEVCNNYNWGTVCDDNFGSSDARVACRQLGFSDGGLIISYYSHVDQCN